MPPLPDSVAPLLQAKGVTKRFAGVVALNDVSIDLYPGELVSLIGPNGSGKTTMFNCITGYLKPEGGQVLFKGKDITAEKPFKIALLGVARTFQNVRIFPALSVLENLVISVQQFQEDNLAFRILRNSRIRRFEDEAIMRAEGLLELTGLSSKRHVLAQSLAYGQRKILEFASALMSDPEVVMLDEFAAGVSTATIHQMKELILNLNKQGKTFLVVEHNMGVVMDISQRIVVLDYGQKIAEGTPREIQRHPKVLEAYFGS